MCIRDSGWITALLGVVAVGLPWGALILMGAGGLVYTIGFVIFVIERPNPWPGVFGFHEVWHVMVLVAALLHYLLIAVYLLPA